MPRIARSCPGGYVYHVWNHAIGRVRLFKKDEDFQAFEQVMVEAHQRHPLVILDWCLLPNEWHIVVQPRRDHQVTDFFRWLSATHSMRWHSARGAVGTGPLYQGRFKTQPVQPGEHLLTLLRFLAQSALRAKLVKTPADWRWTSNHVRRSGKGQGMGELKSILGPWPVPRPSDWPRQLNKQQAGHETTEIMECVKRSRPIGDAKWVNQTAKKLGLESSLRNRGRQPNALKEMRPV